MAVACRVDCSRFYRNRTTEIFIQAGGSCNDVYIKDKNPQDFTNAAKWCKEKKFTLAYLLNEFKVKKTFFTNIGVKLSTSVNTTTLTPLPSFTKTLFNANFELADNEYVTCIKKLCL